MQKTIISILAVMFSLSLFAQEQNITLHTRTGDIQGTTLIPESVGAIPVVILISGSGPTDRDGNNPQMKNNSLKMIAESLGTAGIASLRFDKRGIAASATAGGSESDIRFEHYINDVNDWVELLSKDKRFSDIIIAGHSEGAQIGMEVAAKNSKVKKYIALAGAGEPAQQIIKRQLASQPKQVMDIVNPILDQLEKGDTVANVSPLLYSLFRTSVQPYMISWFKYNPAKTIATLKIPVLILQGDTDLQCLVSDANALKAACPRAKEVIISGMNHVLKACSGKTIVEQMQFYTSPDFPLHPELMGHITAFIKETGSKR